LEHGPGVALWQHASGEGEDVTQRVEIGDCTLYLGDALQLLPTLPAGSVDAVVTDIPYGEVNRESGGLRKLSKGTADVVTFSIEEVNQHCSRLAASNYVFCGTEQVSGLRAGFVERGLTTRLCVWEKTNPSPMNGESFWLSSIECCVFARKPRAHFSEHCSSAVWRGPVAREQVHPTQKPTWLIRRLVKASVLPNGTCLDFCMGSGTTAVACVQTGRKFIGCEIDPAYFEIALQRVREAQHETGLFATRPKSPDLFAGAADA
jgi:site-specific DNA-methyltransferase (adenine-specific)